MSLIDDVLIAVEDKGSIDITELGNLLTPATKQAVYSTTGRLAKRKFLETKSNKISITELGKDYIYRNLDAIKKFEDSSRPFVLVIFEIPETKKVLREKFRIAMNNLGFGSLKRGVMIGAISRPQDIHDVINKLNLTERVVVLKTEFDHSIINRKFQPWNFRKINYGYKKFIEQAKILLTDKKSEATRLRAKQLVLQFARTCKIDPVLPSNMNNNEYLGSASYELYSQIKPLCY